MKKSEKKMKMNWKLGGLAFILWFVSPCGIIDSVAADTSSNVRDRSNSVGLTVTLHGADTAVNTLPPDREEKNLELSQLREEILDLHRRKETLERKYQGLQMRIAGLFGNDMTAQDSSIVEEGLGMAYGALQEQALDCALRSNRIVALLEAVLHGAVSPDSVQKKRFESEMRDARNAATKVVEQVSPSGRKPEDNYRILDVEPDLELVAVSAGYRQGVRTGMVMWVEQESLQDEDASAVIKLRVIEVRPDISAAILLQGDWRKLVPGMAVAAGRKNKQPRE